MDPLRSEIKLYYYIIIIINFDTQIEEVCQFRSSFINLNLFVRGHLGKWPPSWIFDWPIWQNGFDSYINGSCQLWCLYHNFMIHPKNAHYLPHCNSVTTYPNDNVTTCLDVISLTKIVSVENYGVPYI